MRRTTYLIALGSNRRHVRHGGPEDVLNAAVIAMQAARLELVRLSSIMRTPALGPAGRDFANAVGVFTSNEDPAELLCKLKRIEADFGRRSARRWGPRTLDLDIILWSEGAWPDRLRWRFARKLAVPHRAMAVRSFVLGPAAEIAGDWRDPISGARVRHLLFRLRQ